MLKKEGGNKIESCNHPTTEVLNSLQKLFKKKVTIKFKKHKHHPIHKVHSSLQKVLEKEDKTKIEKCNHPTPQVPQFLSEST